MSENFTSPITGLAQNVALLLSLTLLYSVIRPRWLRAPAALQAILAGALFALIAMAGMHTPIAIAPGIIADARTIPVLLAGPFGGVGAAVTAAIMASLYCLALGGVGTVAGIGTIVTAGALGVVVGWWWRGREREFRPRTFLVMGLALDAVLLVWAFALPDAALARQLVTTAAAPVGLFLPIGTLVLGALLVNASRRHDERERLTLAQFSLERTAEALLWIESDGCVVNANPAAERLTGYSRALLLTMRVWDLEVGVDPERWRLTWSMVRVAGSVASEARYRRRDGSEVPVETTSDFVEYETRQWIGVFVRDVTERKRAEQERASLLVREQALRARAEEASVLRDQFLATLSHELRTPLTSILGYAGLLRRGSLQGAAAARALDVIERNTRAQTQIIDDLLDVSSIVMRKLQIERRPLSLAPLVEAEVEAERPAAEARELTLTCVIHRAIPPVVGDADRLRQALRNLLSNAVKFTPAGGHIDVRLEADEKEARIIVRDTGMGIDPAFMPNVFDRFRQADNSMTRAYGGLGVGLAIVSHIIELHRGRVWGESAGPGHGATFTIGLPFLVRAAAAPAVRPSGARAHRFRADREALPDLGGLRVVVVEDEGETRELVATVLAECGAHVTPAASAAEALTEVERVKPHVLVSDIAMPRDDGYELIRRLRALDPERGGRTPAAALTAYARGEDSARVLAAGFEAHIVKPFDPAVLARVVAGLAGRDAA